MSKQLKDALRDLANGDITPAGMGTTEEAIESSAAGSTWQFKKDGKTMTLTKNENPAPDQESYTISWE